MITHIDMPVSWYEGCSHFSRHPPHVEFLRTYGVETRNHELEVFVSVKDQVDFTVIRDWLHTHDFDFNMAARFQVKTFPYRPAEVRMDGMTFVFTNRRDQQLFKLHWDFTPSTGYHC